MLKGVKRRFLPFTPFVLHLFTFQTFEINLYNINIIYNNAY